MMDLDQSSQLQDQVCEAIAAKHPIKIMGGNSKSFYGLNTVLGTPLYTSGHYGIVNYHPSELVMTARAGTLLSEIEDILATQKQMLAFEPPHFSNTATLGGTIACGLSGPRRPFTGSVRDFVLGCKIINGKGEVLHFGGEVMKNVAGYDVSRLMTGAMGTLGVLLEVSLKVLPQPEQELTVCFELPPTIARAKMLHLARQCQPISGLSYDGSMLYVRLAGAEKVIQSACTQIGGDLYQQNNFWTDLNEQRLNFFKQAKQLWRISVPPATKAIDLSGDWFEDWGGSLRWLITDEPPQKVFHAAEQAEGHALLFKNHNQEHCIFQAETGTSTALNHRLKQAFDPLGLFNQGRMFKDW